MCYNVFFIYTYYELLFQETTLKNTFLYVLQLKRNILISVEFHDSFVGFTAWKMTPQLYTNGDTIIYEGVTLNEGGHYQPITGQGFK